MDPNLEDAIRAVLKAYEDEWKQVGSPHAGDCPCRPGKMLRLREAFASYEVRRSSEDPNRVRGIGSLKEKA